MYACSGGGGGAVECARRLISAGARVDGAPARGDDVCTLTPLQVCCLSNIYFHSDDYLSWFDMVCHSIIRTSASSNYTHVPKESSRTIL